jgi:16S rRNA (guanine966-N2)-methyltransferase
VQKEKTKMSKTNKNGYIRIIGGIYKSRKLTVIDAESLRPTTDRVKETVFNWLMFKINNTNVLDLFAGSGSLGFEALSRGAQKVTFIEQNPKVYKALLANAEILKAKNCEILNKDAILFLNTTKETYDLIFIDPPFRKGFVETVLSKLTPPLLKNGSLIYIENEIENPISLPAHFKLLKELKCGQVLSRLFVYENQ